MSKIDIGIKQADRLKIADGLKHLLADSYTLYLQTHNFHWNVEGPQFRELHLMFEEHYTELAIAVDDVAERIRTLDVPAPGTYKELARLSSIKEVEGVPDGKTMVDILTQGHEQVVKCSSWPRLPTTSLPQHWPQTACVFMKKRHGCCAR
jgi:starvation-inducible DNA-binding protein